MKESEGAQPCLTLWDSMDYNLPGSSTHGIFRAKLREWVAISFSRSESSNWSTKGGPSDALHFSRTSFQVLFLSFSGALLQNNEWSLPSSEGEQSFVSRVSLGYVQAMFESALVILSWCWSSHLCPGQPPLVAPGPPAQAQETSQLPAFCGDHVFQAHLVPGPTQAWDGPCSPAA